MRLSLDQVRRDRRAGLRVGAFYSGYSGPALSGLSERLHALAPLLASEDVRFVPGLNDALAASAVAGTQMLDLLPHTRYDGVLGLWFGTTQGLSRALDALHHASFRGISRRGAGLVLVGEDPDCAASPLPGHAEHALAHACMPVLCPADAGEILSLGRHACALSRFAGTWVALQVSADVVDGGRIVELPRREPELALPKLEIAGRRFMKRLDPGLCPATLQRIEHEIVFERLEAVRRYAEANHLDPIEHSHAQDRIGLVACGRLFRELEGALDLLRLDAAALERLGIRVLRVQLIHPLATRRIREFAEGLDEIVVVDERRGFLESQLRAALCNALDPPLVHGQLDERGAPWIARRSEVRAGTLALDLGAHLVRRLDDLELRGRLREIEARASRSRGLAVRAGPLAANAAGEAPSGAPASTGLRFSCAVGHEGASWIGLSHYTDTPHDVQDLSGADYHHSGRLAIRAAVEAGVSITYRLRCGSARGRGGKPVADIAQDLLRDGVAQIVATTRDPALLALAERELRVRVVPEQDPDAARTELGAIPGVSVVLIDQAETPRDPSPARIMIHRDLCDCRSDVLDAHRTGSPQDACDAARSSGEGLACGIECPARLTLDLPHHESEALAQLGEVPLTDPEPQADLGRRYQLCFGGRGSAIVSALLVRAAEIDGLHAAHLDRGGGVPGRARVSHCVLARGPIPGSARVSLEGADVALALDRSAACQPDWVRVLCRQRTRLLADDTALGADPGGDDYAAQSCALERVPACAAAEAVLGQRRQAPVVLLGAALQLGLVPVPVTAVECALRDAGSELHERQLALRLGRVAVTDPERVRRWIEAARPCAVHELGSPSEAAERLGPGWARFRDALRELPPGPEIEWLLAHTASLALDLVDYQDLAYAERYLDTLGRVLEAEARADGKDAALTRAAARELYRVMAYRDGYEVARLLVRGPFRRWLDARGARRIVYHLPAGTLWRWAGHERLALPSRWLDPLLRLVVHCRGLRGSRLDPCRSDAERRFRDWYEGFLLELCRELRHEDLDRARAWVAAPGEVRGFGAVRRACAAEVRARVEAERTSAR